ncbi:MAG: hypothetical protein GY696_19940 [Gammaproteobacteria bacterium]|nr:hypothetical protein [Gammaproteobacteria bacterium]
MSGKIFKRKEQQERRHDGNGSLDQGTSDDDDDRRQTACLAYVSPNHIHGSDERPAKGQRCSAYGNLNHFEKSLPLQESKKTRRKRQRSDQTCNRRGCPIEKVLTGEHQRTYMTAEMKDGSCFAKYNSRLTQQ